MKRLEFSGHSDDTFGWDLFDPDEKSVGGDDHNDCASSKLRAFLISSSTGRVVVTGVYGKLLSATWTIGLGLAEEDETWPDWARQPIWKARGYTPVLSLLVPDDAKIELWAVDGKPPKKIRRDAPHHHHRLARPRRRAAVRPPGAEYERVITPQKFVVLRRIRIHGMTLVSLRIGAVEAVPFGLSAADGRQHDYAPRDWTTRSCARSSSPPARPSPPLTRSRSCPASMSASCCETKAPSPPNPWLP